VSQSRDRIEERARFDYVRYANCWEDADVLCQALAPAPGKRILSIASGGDNSFALAMAGAEVVAVDLSSAQLAMLELKRAAIRALEYDPLLRFLGVRDAAPQDRAETYARIAGRLPADARAFWNARPEDVRAGIVHAGKFERYFRTFRRRVVPLFHGRDAVEQLLADKDRKAREAFYANVWDNWRWRLMFRVFFSRRVMGLMGRDPEFFRYVEGSVADRILQRTRYAFTVLPTHSNPYLNFIFTGDFGATVPRYLERSRFDALREAMDRVTAVRASAEDAARAHGPFDGFNLSDIFEYLDPPTCAAMYGVLLDHSRPGARFAYWNMLVPRRRPEQLASRVKAHTERADALYSVDRAFFYSAFVLEEAI
jgi:S-adenosylmethionine-diacylglycerol 3-amino-3-carboxypropyl transferase